MFQLRLQNIVDSEKLNARQTLFYPIDISEIEGFPQLNPISLQIYGIGTYQIAMGNYMTIKIISLKFNYNCRRALIFFVI